jgi:hypothetical protein
VRRLAGWRSPSPRWRGVVLLAAVGVFVVGVVASFRGLELAPGDVRWWPLLVLAVVGTPATIAVNAAELRVMGHLLGGDLPWSRAVRVVVLATAANVLPVPGGAVVRIQALTAAGAGAVRATGVNLAAALVWVATAVTVAGVVALRLAPGPAVLAVALGGVGTVVALTAVRASATRRSARGLIALSVVELVTTLLHGGRLWLALVVLGVPVGLDRALVIGVAGPLSAAAGVFPSGLGLAEVLAAGLASLVALAPAAGFGATAVVRVVGLATSAPLALVLGVRDVAATE